MVTVTSQHLAMHVPSLLTGTIFENSLSIYKFTLSHAHQLCTPALQQWNTCLFQYVFARQPHSNYTENEVIMENGTTVNPMLTTTTTTTNLDYLERALGCRDILFQTIRKIYLVLLVSCSPVRPQLHLYLYLLFIHLVTHAIDFGKLCKWPPWFAYSNLFKNVSLSIRCAVIIRSRWNQCGIFVMINF